MAFGGREEAEKSFEGGGVSSGGASSGVSSEAPSGSGMSNPFSFLGNAVKNMMSGTVPKDTIPSTQDFNQLKSGYVNNLGFIDALNKDYTISKSGNALYRDTSDMLSARDKAEGLSGRATVASIDPTTGTMFSGVSDPSLSGALSGMITPQRARQNLSRAKAYADRSNKMRGQLRGSGVVPRTGNQGVFGFLDLDKDGGIFTSTDPYGTVYGMSNEAIYDPSLPEAYRGIPSVYAAKTGGQVKTDPNPTLVEQIGSYVMPGAGFAKLGQYFFPDTTQEKSFKYNPKMTDSEFDSFINEKELEYAKITPKVRPYQFDSSNTNNQSPYSSGVTTIDLEDLEESDSNFINFTGNDIYGNPMYSNNPIVGYQADGTTPIYADDPNANQVPYMSVYP